MYRPSHQFAILLTFSFGALEQASIFSPTRGRSHHYLTLSHLLALSCNLQVIASGFRISCKERFGVGYLASTRKKQESSDGCILIRGGMHPGERGSVVEKGIFVGLARYHARNVRGIQSVDYSILIPACSNMCNSCFKSVATHVLRRSNSGYHHSKKKHTASHTLYPISVLWQHISPDYGP